jgi:hypothetical protein
MSLHTSLRFVAVLITVLIATQVKDVVWSSLLWSLAFVHYALALFYSRRRMALVTSQTHSLIPAVGVTLAGAALYLNQFSLLIYFGIHHVFNEVYLWNRTLSVPEDGGRRALRGSAVLLNGFIYAVLLRHYSELSWIDPSLLFAGLLASYGYFFYCFNRLHPSLSLFTLINSCSFELFGLLLVILSLFTPIGLNHIVLYHFIFWSLYPINKFYKQGHGELTRYLVVSLVLLGIFLLFSPMGVSDRAASEYYYYEQFLFWSFVHITLSFFLSDAHPAWITRWFRLRPKATPSS